MKRFEMNIRIAAEKEREGALRGGYGVVIHGGIEQPEIKHGFEDATGRRIVLYATIAGLELLPNASIVNVYSCEKYLVDAFNEGWLARWQTNGWRTANRTPVSNRDLWECLLAVIGKRQVTWHWISAKVANAESSRAFALAHSAMKSGDAQRDEDQSFLFHLHS